jgi:hypothetical protein
MRLLAFLSLISLSFGACTSSSTDPAHEADASVQDVLQSDDAGQEGTDTFVEPVMPDIQEGWTQIETGGDTICSRGSKYFFMARKGSVNRIVIDFMGGGACWNETTCSFSGSIFNENLSAFEGMEGDVDLPGIYDRTEESNPFKDWYHIFIPYCTGDIHWGNSEVDYGDAAGVIHHKGAVNSQAVMDWISENFSSPEKIFVTGCSAGAYGSIGWAPRIIEQFPDSKVYQMGDSGVGVITDDFFQESFPKWNAWGILPEWIDTLALPEEELNKLDLEDVYIRIANYYPDYLFSQFTTAFDKTQVFYYQAMGGGTPEEWASKMQAGLEKTRNEAPNFRSFIAQGNEHCIVPYAEFFTKETQGLTASEWAADIVDEQDIENVDCGDDCE